MSFGKPSAPAPPKPAAQPANWQPIPDKERKARDLDKMRRGTSNNNSGLMTRMAIDNVKKTLLGG